MGRLMSDQIDGKMLDLTKIKVRAEIAADAWDEDPICDPYPMAESMADVPVLVAEVVRLRAQTEAMCRLLVDSGDMTPVAVRQIRKVTITA